LPTIYAHAPSSLCLSFSAQISSSTIMNSMS
jgi:hypothetical protein